MVPLYTRKGDDGETVLFGGTRARKDDPRIETYGSVDELNAQLGLAVCLSSAPDGDERANLIKSRLTCIQGELFSIGAALATPGDGKRPAVCQTHIARLEKWIDEASEPVAALRAFILPGGCEWAARLHVCRTVCRRAERRVVAIEPKRPADLDALRYLNRLGDLLFAWARFANHATGTAEVEWTPSGEA